MKQRRILLISVAAVIGGAEVYLERLAAILEGRERMFAVCVHPALTRQLRARGVTVFQVPSPFGKRVQRIAKYPLCFFVALYAILRSRVRAVHLNGYQAAFLIIPIRALGCHVLLTPHHLPLSRLARSWYLANARWAHTIVNVSMTVDQQHRVLLPSMHSVVIPNWMPAVPAEPLPRTSAPTRQVLFVGRLVANKGLPDLIEAMRNLNGEVTLVVAGDGPLRAEYEALAEGLPVRFLGYHEDLSDLFGQVDALIVPSHGPEGSCLVALEAMAHGLPCLMSDLAVYQEIADNGNAAMLFAAGDCEALAAAIRALTTDRIRGAKLAAYAYEMIHKKYGVDAATAAYLQAFGIESSPVRRDEYRPRVLLFSMTPFFGGGEAYYVKLAKLLHERYEVAAVAADSHLYEQFIALHIPTHRMSYVRVDGAIFRYPKAAFTLAKRIRSFRPDCVHLNGQAESYFACVPAIFGIPMISTRHTAFDEKVPAFRRFAVALNLRMVRTTVCVSSLLMQQLTSKVGKRRLVTIPNWLDSLPKPMSYAPPRAEEVFRLLYVGRIVRDKGIFDLIAAMRGLADVSLDVVGEGADAAEARESARGLPITFHSFQKDPSTFYRNAHLLAFPSHSEGHPLVPIEAMSHGLPCLLSDIEVNQETAGQGRTAQLFKCGNVDDLATNIRALHTDPQRLFALSKNGVERVRLNCTKEQVRGQYFNVFDEVIGGL